MTTYANFVIVVARALRDPAYKVFSAVEVGDMIATGLSEVSRLAPQQFQQDIAVVGDGMEYPLNGTSDAEIEVVRVEVWDATTTPPRYLWHLRPGGAMPLNDSGSGWRIWAGTLYLSNAQENLIDPVQHYLRVWGYGPYTMVSGSTPMPCGPQLEQAIISFCRVEALRRLSLDRDLFAQWQTRANNSDVSPGALMSMLQLAEDDWRRKSKAIFVLREVS